MKKPSKETIKKAKRTVCDFVKWSATYRDAHFEEVESWLKHYKVEESLKMYDGRANMADTSSHENIETIAPQVLSILIDESGELQYRTSPVDGDDDREMVKAPNAIIAADLKMSKSREKMLQAMRTIPQYGTVVYEVPWKDWVRSKNEPKYSEPKLVGYQDTGEVDEFGNPIQAAIFERELIGYERVENVVYSGVNWEYVPWNAVWLDPFTANVDEAQGIVRERNIPLETLRKEQIRTEDVRSQNPDGSISITKTPVGHYFKDELDKVEKRAKEEIEQKGAGNEDSANKPQDDFTPRIEVPIRTYYGWFDYNGDGKAVDCVITLAGGKSVEDGEVIQLEPTQYPLRPYIVVRHIALDGQTYGLSALKIMSKTQQFINDTVNQTFDNVTMSLLKMWKKLSDSDLDEKDLRYEQGKVIEVESMDEIEPIDVPYVTQHGYDMVGFLKENNRQAVGAFRNLQAAPMKYHTTAREVNQMDESANARHVIHAIAIEEELIIPLLRRIVEYNHRFGRDTGKVARLTNDPQLEQMFFAIPPLDIAAQYDFTALGASDYQKKQNQRAAMMEFTQGLAAITQAFTVMGPPDESGIDLNLLLTTYSDTFDFPNADEIFNADKAQPGQPPISPDENDPVAQVRQQFGDLI